MEEKMLIRDTPKEERPRERFLQEGPKSLSNQELLALLIRTGTKNESVIQLSSRLIRTFEGLRLLKDASIEEITAIHGIGEAKAIQILAAIEIGRRINSLNNQDRYVIRSPEDCANYCMDEMRFLSQEHFVCLYLNTKNQVLHKQTIFIGSLNASIVHPREVYKEAFRRSAASIICLHNHPSGDPQPSREDIEVTKRLVECGKIIGIELLDHVIIGDQKFISLKEKGYL
ncbi:DNA repair protein RadC [Peribacillus psychrosaccharolyticus]|uniref:DNA repair protein RadC n=1 Tax=Peribacillus psychrosaccharolyticus TaxID=1407 RepID=A0A974NKZ9_PERPY|nr:DNA repair protein RadC [Peribacillus psychrosaccharolyticus]MEC2054576.1 DNA repair protein RadC [Peribacillus psychrosaccharolyticus]MED3744197.1 DNA repair protein RadC [Peribacillus psychrosaccharolyticus]QQS99687.1 DNA repair protein RadC [Peribacillus psychrosaccharolyticus]